MVSHIVDIRTRLGSSVRISDHATSIMFIYPLGVDSSVLCGQCRGTRCVRVQIQAVRK